MAENYQQLWKNVTNANGEVEAVRTLAEILTDREGRAFILSLERPDAELCIEILDRVSHRLDLDPSLVASEVLSGHHKMQPQNYRETRLLRYVKETRRTSWATARIHDNIRKD